MGSVNQELITREGIVTDVVIQKRKEYTVAEFILQTHGDKPHHYKITALTRGDVDDYQIINYEGERVLVKCYLNGRQQTGSKGTYYSNDLSLKTISRV